MAQVLAIRAPPRAILKDRGHVTKIITTPEIPPKPDIVLLVDHTGSMTEPIASVQAEMGNIISTVKGAQPGAQFAVAQYCDPPEDPFDVLQDLTASDAVAQAAVDGITLCDGGDEPEAQLNALWEIGDGGVSEPTGSTSPVRRRGSPLRPAVPSSPASPAEGSALRSSPACRTCPPRSGRTSCATPG